MECAVPTFIVHCPQCKAKVGVLENGRAERSGFNDDAGEPWAERICVGACPSCGTLLVGESYQIDFKGFCGDEVDRWSDFVRVYPEPSKTFSSHRIPNNLTTSLSEGDRSMQAGANIAACVMFGRALEALCRDLLDGKLDSSEVADKPKRRVMLGAGIRELKERGIIDERLFNWSQDLN